MFLTGKKAKTEKIEKKEKTPLTQEQRKKRRKRIIFGAIAVIAAAAIVLPRLFAPEVLPVVNVVEVGKGEVEQTIEGSGTVKSEEVKTYFSPVSATIEAFDLKVGDMVEAGEILLTYDETELNQLYRQAELTGSAANYSYQDAINKDNENVSEYQRSSAALEVIESQLEKEKDESDHVQDRIEEYSEKQADVQLRISEQQVISSNAQAKIDQANQDKKEAEDLKASVDEQLKEQEQEEQQKPAEGGDTPKEGITPEEAEKQKADADVIIANADKVIAEQTVIRDKALEKVKGEQKELEKIKEKISGYQERLEDSGENLQELQTDKAKEQGIKESSDAAILSNEAKQQLAANNSLSSLNAQMTKEDISAGKSGIRAEFSGVVTEVSAVSGGPAAKGGSLFCVASNENVIVDMSVTRYDLEKLEVGQSAEITLAGKSYTGTVSKLSRLAAANEKGTPVVSAEIHVENPDENIYLGLEANVKVNGHKEEDVIVVPLEAVNTGKDGNFCYIVENGIVVKKEVETGLASATMVEIKTGLKAGDKVIRSGIEIVEEGMKVTAVEE